jgi:hypothetical protein
MGHVSPEEVVNYYRHGDQTLMVYQGDKVGLLLPFVASFWNYDSVNFAKAVIQKAGITEPPYNWCRFDSATWFAGSEGVWATIGGFATPRPDLPPINELSAKLGKLHLRYLLKHLRDDGTFYSAYQPFHNRLLEHVDVARLAHGAWVLSRTEEKNAAGRVIDTLVEKLVHEEDQVWLTRDNESPSVAELSFLLLALINLPDSDLRRSLIKDLANTLWRCVELPHGRIATHKNRDTPSLDAFQDYFPGQVLLALATACEANVSTIDEERLRRSFQYYRHRFRYKRHFGQVTWLLQAFSKWWQVTGERQFADMVFEIADWLLGYQQDKTGAFINDHQSNTPGYTTGVYLEGIAAALQIEQAVKIEQVRKRGLPPLSQQRGQAALPDLFFSRRSTYYDSHSGTRSGHTPQPGFRSRWSAPGSSLQRDPHRFRATFTLSNSRVLSRRNLTVRRFSRFNQPRRILEPV